MILERRTKHSSTVYVTNAPAEEFTAAELMDAFFARWPLQEHVFRELNQAVAFKTIHGYGKRRVLNVTVVDELTKLSAQIARATERLGTTKADLQTVQLRVHQTEVADRAVQRRVESARHQQRVLAKQKKAHTARHQRAREAEESARRDRELSSLRLEKARSEQKTAEAKLQKLEATIREKNVRHAVLDTRREIYQNDVELDQILSVLKLGFALMVQFLLHKFFEGLPIEVKTFIRELLELPGARIRTATTETIQFRANRRNPDMMAALDKACVRFNALGHRRDDRVVRFEISWPDAGRHAG